MDLLRKHLWLWVVFGMVFMSVAISIVFLFICKCLSRRGKHRISRLKKEHSFRTESNKYQDRNIEAGIPPLPPRTQFLTAETQSYENLAEEQVSQNIHGYGESIGNCRQNVSDHEESTHDYEEGNHDYEESNHDYEESTHDYEEGNHDYEESTDPPDYVKMEEEVIFPPPLPYDSMNGCVLEAQSYENLAEEQVSQNIHGYGENIGNCRQNVSDHEESTHDYEESTHDYEEGNHDYEESTDPPDYVKMEEEVIFPPPPPYDSMNGCVLEAQSYENLAEENDYEECTDDQYVKVDEEAQAGDNSSTEDYDDIGGGDQDEEDYDDVG